MKELTESIAAWRKSKHPRFAAIADFATLRALPQPRALVGDSGKAVDVAKWHELFLKRDPLDLPRLLATVGSGKSSQAVERLTLLATLNDPRVVSGTLALLESPPYRAQTALPFFRTCASVLAAANDPRVRPALEALAVRYKSILETSVGDLVANLLRRTANELDLVKPGPLSAALEKKAAELEAAFETERTQTTRAASSRRSATQNDDALLEAVYAAPDDDTPRLVFADALTERGDERGELIALQLARARGPVSDAAFARERAVLQDKKRVMALCHPLSQGGACTLARGFPVSMFTDTRTVKHVVSLPALRTLRTLSMPSALSGKLARELLTSEHTRGLHTVDSLTRAMFDALGEQTFDWRELHLDFVPMGDDLTRAPKLEHLVVSPAPEGPASTADVSRLLEVTWRGTPKSGVLSRMTTLQRARVLMNKNVSAIFEELATLRALRALELLSPPKPDDVRGLALEALTTRYTPELDLAGLSDALPKLKHLHVVSDATWPDMISKMLRAAEHLKRLETFTYGELHFTRPFSTGAALDVSPPLLMNTYVERLATVLARLPADITASTTLRPREWTNPAISVPRAVDEAHVKVLREANPALKLKVAWY